MNLIVATSMSVLAITMTLSIIAVAEAVVLSVVTIASKIVMFVRAYIEKSRIKTIIVTKVEETSTIVEATRSAISEVKACVVSIMAKRLQRR